MELSLEVRGGDLSFLRFTGRTPPLRVLPRAEAELPGVE